MKDIKFRVNAKKALEAILYVASNCVELSFHSICKLFFYADVYHLNKYGRPVTGDEYRALKYGPVPITTYDLLKQDLLLFEALDEEPPFTVKKIGSKPIVEPQREAQTEYFSKSDIEALNYAIQNYANLSFSDLTDISHEHPAWKNTSPNEIMNYEYFIEPENQELINELRENSRYISI